MGDVGGSIGGSDHLTVWDPYIAHGIPDSIFGLSTPPHIQVCHQGSIGGNSVRDLAAQGAHLSAHHQEKQSLSQRKKIRFWLPALTLSPYSPPYVISAAINSEQIVTEV